MMSYTLKINGTQRVVDVDADTPLLWVLRDTLGMTGTKYGCGVAQCGACTVHADGTPIRSCQLPVSSVGTMSITTIEGIGADKLGRKLQAAWLTRDVPQCGYCQGGQILAATALLTSTPNPTEQEIDDAMVGNICRCGTYPRIRQAIKDVAASLRGGKVPA
jgi:isoquinoline 1-oxidoreductase subunit alpha